MGTKRTAKCDFGDRRNLEPAQLFPLLRRSEYELFESEAAYRRWFVSECLDPIISNLYVDDGLLSYRTEIQIPSTTSRIDILATLKSGRQVGFELKARNKKAPHVGKHEIVLGVGQAWLYQDMLTARFGRFVPVFLVCDAASKEVAGLIYRHGNFIGLIEANPANIFCMAHSPSYGRS